MKLIIGLGNPGKEYEKSRHNAGFMCVELFREKIGAPEFKLEKKFEAIISEHAAGAEKIILALPHTFMNLSGYAVSRLVNFYHIDVKTDFWIVYDDLDLPLGQIRIRPDGSPGTHNGMKSVCEKLGTQNFPRLRIGIESRGASAPKEQDTTSFVLHAFNKDERETVKKSLIKAADALWCALREGIAQAMEKYNLGPVHRP